MTPTVADLQAEIACLRQQVASLQKDNTCLRNKLRDLRVSKTFDNFDFSADTKDAKLSLVADEKPENL